MRFDDRLETALVDRNNEPVAQLGQWRQLIDLLAQDPNKFPQAKIAEALATAHHLSRSLSVEDRLHGVNNLSGRIKSPPLVHLLSNDDPRIAIAAIRGARLSDAQWSDLVPHLPVRARGFLRNRDNLGPKTLNALRNWSGADFVLPNPHLSDAGTEALIVDREGPGAKPNDLENQLDRQNISDIVARIESLRRSRETSEAPFLPFDGGEIEQVFDDINEIRFETDDAGIVNWVEGAPRGALVGVAISEPGYGDGPGPDAFGAAAFRQRMPLENARMRLCGAPTIEGDWRINATPFFDHLSGRFKGYRGIMRRPNLAESPRLEPNEDRNQEYDQLQQLLHELRTPLGAIIGFAEIIEQQLFGPVSSEYRTLARTIHNDAERLLAGFDDLAMTARLENGRFEAGNGTTPCGWLVRRLAERLHSLSDAMQVNLNLSTADPVRAFAVDSALTERIFSRLLSAVMMACEPSESLDGRFRTEIGHEATNRFILTLPSKLLAMDQEALFGSGIGANSPNDDAPLLGLGFSLRLVRSLAQNVGGNLRFYNDSLILSLPAAREGQMSPRLEDFE